MNALAIDPITQKVEPIEIEMKANTTYTFFSSILIDEFESIRDHVIYADANALSEAKEAYFIGEQLVLGKALILGRADFDDRDVTITPEELSSLIQYEVPLFYQKALALLRESDLNLYRTFEVEKQGERLLLSSEWVLYTFNIADDRTRDYFLAELAKVIEAKESAAAFMQKMAQLAINAAG